VWALPNDARSDILCCIVSTSSFLLDLSAGMEFYFLSY
jgi:hypothetical protein